MIAALEGHIKCVYPGGGNFVTYSVSQPGCKKIVMLRIICHKFLSSFSKPSRVLDVLRFPHPLLTLTFGLDCI